MAEGVPLTEISLYSDLLRAALAEVDWQEIADHLLDDVEESEGSASGPVVFRYTQAEATPVENDGIRGPGETAEPVLTIVLPDED